MSQAGNFPRDDADALDAIQLPAAGTVRRGSSASLILTWPSGRGPTPSFAGHKRAHESR